MANEISGNEKNSVDEPFAKEDWKKGGLIIVVMGASGDLAKKKTFPSLLDLYADNLLPSDLMIWGYARSDLGDDGLRDRLRPYLQKAAKEGKKITQDHVNSFTGKIFYQQGKSYGDIDAFENLASKIEEHEKKNPSVCHNRLFYFAIPPNVFAETGEAVKLTAMATRGWTRVIVEKPFGRDLKSYEKLSKSLSQNFEEKHLYRIDHYLGKEMVQNLLVLRFGNLWFERLWNRDNIQSVTLTFKEPFGTEGRGGYFDKYGIIRDIQQNHLLQVFCLMAMEAPLKLVGEESGQFIRDAKCHVLNATEIITLDNVILGQYEGYTDDESIDNKDSNTPTFAVICLYINTPRWAGVPFILKAGKAMNEHKTEMRVQFKDIPASEYLFDTKCARNELVMKMRPSDAIYMKTNVKRPGYHTVPVQSELEVNYNQRYSEENNPDAYSRLILDVLRGRQGTFVRDDELRRSWEIFTPILHKIEGENIRPIIYQRGSRGPKEADDFIARKTDFEFHAEYSHMYHHGKASL